MPKHGSVLFYVDRNLTLGRGARDGHLDFYTASGAESEKVVDELMLNVLRCHLTY